MAFVKLIVMTKRHNKVYVRCMEQHLDNRKQKQKITGGNNYEIF